MGDVIHKGEVLLIVHRRLYTDDEPRFFVGTVDQYDDGLARVTGYTWQRDPHSNGAWHRKDDERTKLVALASVTLIAYSLPVESAESLELVRGAEGQVLLRDGQGFEMDLSERMPA